MKSQADRLIIFGDVSQRLLTIPTDTTLRLLVLAAHPDDETIGASALLATFPSSAVVYLTDGAPRDPRFWTGGPYTSREDYARTRRKEAAQALEYVAISDKRVFWLGGVDQEVAFEMPSLAAKLADVLRERTPHVLITHSYEGGHPDHDSASLTAWLAVSQLGESRPEILEMTSYHASDGQCVTGEFLNATAEIVIELSEIDQRRKRKMLDAYASQRLVLESFGTDRERFRKASVHDFSMPPHEGKLWYECMAWPMTGAYWRELATAAIRAAAMPAAESSSCR
jgi:LmbE family N-acetylglucosaminyl deacetylase